MDTIGRPLRTTPRYIAHVVGEPTVAYDAGNIIFVVGFPCCCGCYAKGFTLQMLFGEDRSNIDFNQLGWHVVWMGVEG